MQHSRGLFVQDAISLEDSSVPERFGPFILLRRLGVGGMGVAHLAADTSSERLFVVKRLRSDLASDPTVMRRFAHEARVAEHVRHPNVAAPVAMGTVEGEAFLATEHVFGVAVSEIIALVESGEVAALPLGVALSIAVGVASGLEAIHGARHRETGATLGLIHRDLGARNVLVGFDGSPRIIDLGLGKSSLANWQTAADALSGSPDYMAPEQAAGGAVDARSDVYSAAVLIWELFAGRKRIREPNVAARLVRAMEAKPEPLRRFRADAPEALENALLEAMASEPDRRTESAADLKAALMRVWSSTGIDASPMEVVAWMDAALPRVRRREELALEEARADAHAELDARREPLDEFTTVRAALDFRSPYDFYGAADETSQSHPALDRCPPDFIERITTEVRARFGKSDVVEEEASRSAPEPGLWRRLGERLRTAIGLIALSSLAGIGTAAALSMQHDRTADQSRARRAPRTGVTGTAVAAHDSSERPRVHLAGARLDMSGAFGSSGSTEWRGLEHRRRVLVERVRQARELQVDVRFQRKVTQISSALSQAETPAALEAVEHELTALVADVSADPTASRSP